MEVVASHSKERYRSLEVARTLAPLQGKHVCIIACGARNHVQLFTKDKGLLLTNTVADFRMVTCTFVI